MLAYDELTPPERRVWDAFPEGRMVDLSGTAPGGPGGTVRAGVLAALLLGANPPRPGAVAALRLTGARVTGALDLSGADIGHVITLRRCRLEEPVLLHGAATRTLRLGECRVPAVYADLAAVEGRLTLNGTVLDGGPLTLVNARITGELQLNGARISGAGDDWALRAGGLVMGGGVFCGGGFRARGGLRLTGAQLPGGLFLAGAEIEALAGTALSAANAQAGTVDLAGITVAGAIAFPGAQITDRLSFAGARLGECTAVSCDRLTAVGLGFTPAVPPAGPVDLSGAQVTDLEDDAAGWPETVLLDGFTYQSIRPAGDHGAHGDVRRRLAWIRRAPGYAPQPYEQLAT